MKKFFVFLIMLSFSAAAFAAPSMRENLPKGTFKKDRNGKIVQYDSHGKKMGIYKMNNGKYVKVK